jgi:hypothetical protein
MKVGYSEMIEELTGRKVFAFLSQAHAEPDLTVDTSIEPLTLVAESVNRLRKVDYLSQVLGDL